MELHRYNVYIAIQQAKRGSAKQDAPYPSLITDLVCDESWSRACVLGVSRKSLCGKDPWRQVTRHGSTHPKVLRVLGNEFYAHMPNWSTVKKS